jgi:hypothetical protein
MSSHSRLSGAPYHRVGGTARLVSKGGVVLNVGPEWIILLFFIAVPIACGFATMEITKGKGWASGGEKFLWFVLGFCFPLIGIIIAALINPKPPAARTVSGSLPPPPPSWMPG